MRVVINVLAIVFVGAGVVASVRVLTSLRGVDSLAWRWGTFLLFIKVIRVTPTRAP